MDYLNLLLENLDLVIAGIFTVVSFFFGVNAATKLKNIIANGKDLFFAIQKLFLDLNRALEDNKLSREETKELKADMNKVKEDFFNLFFLDKKGKRG